MARTTGRDWLLRAMCAGAGTGRLPTSPPLHDRITARTDMDAPTTPHASHPPRRASLLRFAGLVLIVLLAGCGSLPAKVARAPSTAFVEGSGPSPLQQVAAASLAADAPALSGFQLLPNGPHALDARLALAKRAERTLDLQAYLIADDHSGRQVLRALGDAARRGVRVRLLVDDLHAAPVLPLLTGLAAQANVEVRMFNPLPVRSGSVAQRVLGSLHELGRINQRMHNKLFIADNALAIAGGRNLGDEYFMRSAQANFIDMDVLAAGPVVNELSALFDSFWNSERAWPVAALEDSTDGSALRLRFDAAVAVSDEALPPQLDALGRPSLEVQLSAGPRIQLHAAPAQLLADAPDKGDCVDDSACPASAVDRTLALVRSAEASVAIVSPYFVPGADGVATLRDAARRGVRLQLLTNSIGATDEPLVHHGYARYRPALLEAGVEIRELSPTLTARTTALGAFGRSTARLHAKVAVIDRRQVVIGSLNMDPRSRRLNTEIGVAIHSPALAAELARLSRPEVLTGSYRLRRAADGAIEWLMHEDGREHALADEPDSSWTLRLKLALMSLLIGEDWL
ncbi:phospholipase D family protein [Aquincola sp. S2]|uniref:Phospholipase D family protein n=1 Tax=Pseudaquabacterium terrae TaxID=2732868 RepID=A0ABX2EE71_9BURK|nr:phospholipase D family protein [Aquabacterium terrae]NRF66917.1 phospholipase D family protein [Aquabacterium terrae]